MSSKWYPLNWKTFFFVFGILLISGSVSVLVSQDQPDQSQEGAKLSIQDFDPIAEKDSRIVLNNLNLDRRFATNGLGEFLDVSFDIFNQTSEAIDLYAFVMAYHETDAIMREARDLIPYPEWRVNDPDRNRFLVHFITVTPLDIQSEEVWSTLDPSIKATFENIVNRMRNLPIAVGPIDDVLPPFWGYVSYVSQKPTQGLRFRLFGEAGPSTEQEALQTNYIPPTDEERKKWTHPTLPQHKYTLEHSRRHSVFRSHHYSPFRANYKFFNMVSILLFDAAKVEANEQAQDGAQQSNALVYKRTFRLSRKLKVY